MASPQVPQLENQQQHPVDAAAVCPMAPKRPSIESPKKRKLSEADDTSVASPTSPATAVEQLPISPKKKARAEPKRDASKEIDIKQEQQEQQQQQQQPMLAFEPIPMSAEPQPFTDEELRILSFFLDA